MIINFTQSRSHFRRTLARIQHSRLMQGAKRHLGWVIPKQTWLRRTLCAVFAGLALILASSYGIAYWYQQKHKNDPLIIGTTFIPSYAEYFGLDPKETLGAIINELGFQRLRLVSYWNELEPQEGVYDFSRLDWQFEMAEKTGVDINLALGLRQPRWPECHKPSWAANQPKEYWYPRLSAFMTKVVERYKDSPSLISYQVENEYLLEAFGECSDFDRSRLIEEVELVRRLDPGKPIIITRSNNWGGIPIRDPVPDVYGAAVYKRIFDNYFTHRYFEYPYPPWYYAFLGGAGEIVHGKPLIIHELQTEPWLPAGYDINDPSTINEQAKTMNAKLLKDRITYATDTGLRTIDLWGAEWWYWQKEKLNNPDLWITAKEELSGLQNH